jgi:protein O-GlcNAc transferase
MNPMSTAMNKTGRNDPCPCGSGKKYKQCCQSKDEAGALKKRHERVSRPASLQAALHHHQSDRLAEAEAIYRQLLRVRPNDPDALHFLGLAAHQTGQHDTAVELISKAIHIAPAPHMHCNLGNVLQAQGKLDMAIKAFQQALVLNRAYPEAHNNLASAYRQQGKLDAALASCREALRLKPDFALAYNNLAAVLQDQGNVEAAVENYRKALAHKPDYAEASANLGVALQIQGKLDEAIDSYRHALALRPNAADIHRNLGSAFKQQGALDAAAASYESAIACQPNFALAHNELGTVLEQLGKYDAATGHYQKAIASKGDYAEAHNNLGNVFHMQGNPLAAIERFRTAVVIQPNYAEAWNNLANTLQSQGDLDQANESYYRALAFKPDYAEAHNNLGNLFKLQGKLSQAIQRFQQALAFRPNYLEAHSNLLFTLSSDADYTAQQYLDEARRYGEKVSAQARPYASWPVAARSDAARLRVGLVSGDLKAHPVGYFLESIIAHLDPARVELVAYSTKLQEDELTARIKPRFTAWHSIVGLSDEAAARRIHDDGVQVLLDLAGHTAFNRLPVFAWKPAPVQASWLGYFASTGLTAMDYALADPVSVPEAHRDQFTETVWYLPETRLCFTPPATDIAVAPLSAVRNGYLTFGCFQTLSKISDEVLAAWGAILRALPQARLRVQNKQMSCASTREELERRLAQAGIAPERVTLAGPMPREAYLAAHAEVDILLDTFPYPGGTTTCEALWMGVPTVTLAGGTMLARQGASLLACAGLADWIAGDREEYVALSVKHAGDLGRLAQLRAGLRQQVQASPLFDAARFAAQLENALHGMWQKTA